MGLSGEINAPYSYTKYSTKELVLECWRISEINKTVVGEIVTDCQHRNSYKHKSLSYDWSNKFNKGIMSRNLKMIADEHSWNQVENSDSSS